MEQINLFGVAPKKIEAEKTKEKAKSEFPNVSLSKVLNRQEAVADAVFWHRILANNSVRASKAKTFLQTVGNEIHLKKGTKDSYKAIQDSIVKNSF
jgi:hypothetical protein